MSYTYNKEIFLRRVTEVFVCDEMNLRKRRNGRDGRGWTVSVGYGGGVDRKGGVRCLVSSTYGSIQTVI